MFKIIEKHYGQTRIIKPCAGFYIFSKIAKSLLNANFAEILIERR